MSDAIERLKAALEGRYEVGDGRVDACRRRRSSVRIAGLIGLLVPSLLSAQGAPDSVRARLDALLNVPTVDSLMDELNQRFLVDVMMLAPDLSASDREILTDAVDSAFAPSSVRLDLVRSMAPPASVEILDDLLRLRSAGARAAAFRIAASFERTESLFQFTARLGPSERERIQRMVPVVEASGAALFDLNVSEALRSASHDLVNALGAGLGPFEGVADEDFTAAYRDRTITNAAELLYQWERVPDSLIVEVLAEYRSDQWQWYADAYAAAMHAAIQSAGGRVSRLLTVDAAVPPSESGVQPDALCRMQTCGFVVDWRGGEPTERNGLYGAAADLEARLLGDLRGRGYNLARGISEDGLTIRLRAESTTARCDFLPGTDTRGCVAVGRVRVEFMGSQEAYESPGSFLLQNRCGADEVMHVDGYSTELAHRLHEALTFEEEEARPSPRC